jgi:hypothetical protein
METWIRKKIVPPINNKYNDGCTVLKTLLIPSGYQLLSLAKSKSKTAKIENLFGSIYTPQQI